MKEFKIEVTAWIKAWNDDEALEDFIKNIKRHVNDLRNDPNYVNIEQTCPECHQTQHGIGCVCNTKFEYND